MKIQLLKAGVVKKVISKSAPIGADGSGSFTWKVPFNQELGNNYKIRVISTSDPTKRDASDKVFAPPCDIHPKPAFSGNPQSAVLVLEHTLLYPPEK